MTKQFRFRLEVVRKLREEARDAARRKFAGAIGVMREAEHRLDELADRSAENVADMREFMQTGPLDMHSLRLRQYFAGLLSQLASECAEHLHDQRSRVEVERARFTEANAGHKAIETLRERRLRAHVVAINRDEQIVMDEVAARIVSRAGAAQLQ